MKRVIVEQRELLETLRQNRANHAENIEDLRRERRETMEAQLEELLRLCRDRGNKSWQGPEHLSFPMPESHLADYDRAIKMVEMSVEGHIELDQMMFDQLVMDNWHWKADLLRTASTYGFASKLK